MYINELLQRLIETDASDLHITAPSPPVLRIDGELLSQMDLPKMTDEDVYQAFLDITTEEQRKLFDQELELDFAYSIRGNGRFRVNASLQRGTISLSFRLIRTVIPDIDGLRLPEVCKVLALKEHGLVLITGPAGSGKSTTLAAMIEHLNMTTCRRVITIEDPIEFQHENKRCFISQRQVGTDTKSFAVALKHALRQDPDVILVGEMRDLETIATVLTAAETGHLILATLHTPGASQAIDRVIDVFPPHQQQQVRIQLSTTLQGVLYQTLIPMVNGSGRIVAVEVMIANDAVKNLIREAKTPQMVNVMQTGAEFGMQTLDQALIDLFRRGLISLEETLTRCRDPEVAKKTLVRSAVR
ncbi:MAG: type IV pilus twitching motility protein PilT [Dehalococcoidia bacterium]